MRLKPFRAFLLVLAIATAATRAEAQDHFEVVSLKPSNPGSRLTSTLDAAQFRGTAHSLMYLIMSAYPDIEVQPWKVSGGPSWLTTDVWDFAAKLPPNMPAEQQALYRRTEQMLRTFLAEEFKLKTHRESKPYPVYALTVGKSGSKLKTSEHSQFGFKGVKGRVEFQHQSMSGLAGWLYSSPSVRQPVDRPVIDQTGLEGFFDFAVEWSPEGVDPDPNPTGPSIYTAVQEQLGLKLQPTKLPVDFLVIDSAEKPTSKAN